ncbi:serine hydrolase domain-containing protein [Nocardioides litoris]|uniref:serine hydrolase domain-containing protein n=1 Tax=Nocardioides litoris TaxID=1926648 RepID=UPI00111EB576|nr:serine hydrolase domain-containing protein [Nocardioides litoris]
MRVRPPARIAAATTLVLAGSLLASTPAATASPSPAAPRVVGPTTAERPTPRSQEQRLRRALRKVVRAGAVGVTAQVVDRGQVWSGAAGAAQRSPYRRATPDARFRAASVTKMVTSTMALQLVDRGTWTLDTTIGDVLPGAWPARSDVTLRQLLSHTSGLPDYLVALGAEGTTLAKFRAIIGPRRTDRELLAVAKGLPSLFEPGTSWGYSNTNFVVVGMMLRRQTGVPLTRLAERRVLRPAGMDESTWAVRKGLRRPALVEYAGLGRDGRQVPLREFSPTMFSGAGALVSTARDLNRFQWALSSGRLLRPATVRLMRSVVNEPARDGLPYGYGSYRLPDPCRDGGSVHGHDGASWATLTFSFSSANGRRRVTVAMTGREYSLEETPAADALHDFLEVALATTCRGSAGGSGGSGGSGRVDGVRPPLPAASVRPGVVVR